MNTEEFSDKFDILINSYTGQEVFGDTRRIQSIEFNEYEKSVFLSDAQLEIVKTLYTDFENRESSRQYLKPLVKGFSSTEKITSNLTLDSDTEFFVVPNDVLFIITETIISDQIKASVLPITHDEYNLQVDNPYRKPANSVVSKRAWRLDYSNLEDKKVVELKYVSPITSYNLRYVKFPKPIITTTLPNGLEIFSNSEISESELDENIHKDILELAVRKAIQSRTIFQAPQNNQNSNQ